jgi:hypothetical protein
VSDEKPAFEVRDTVSGHVYKIWADGQIEGFGTAGMVVNRIPQITAKAVEAYLESHDDSGED